MKNYLKIDLKILLHKNIEMIGFISLKIRIIEKRVKEMVQELDKESLVCILNPENKTVTQLIGKYIPVLPDYL